MATYTKLPIIVGYIFFVFIVYIESYNDDIIVTKDTVSRINNNTRPSGRRPADTLTNLLNNDAAEQTIYDSGLGDVGVPGDMSGGDPVKRRPFVAEAVVAAMESPPDPVPQPGPNELTDKQPPIIDLRPQTPSAPPTRAHASHITHITTNPVTSNTPEVTSNHEHQTTLPEVTVAVTTSQTTSQSTEADIGACASSPCLNGGTCSPEGSTYKCLCGSKNGGELFGGYRCEIKVAYEPRLTRMEPGYGPVAGDTSITIYGSSLLLPVDGVYIGRGENRHRCHVIKSDGLQIVARTPEYKGYLLYLALPVTVHFAGGLVLPDKLRHLVYEYRHNPVLESIHPLESISRGGTLLTVHGRHLDSVPHPEVKVILVYRNNTGGETDSSLYTETRLIFYQACLLTNRTSSLLLCRVPRLDIPVEFLNIKPAAETSTRSPREDSTTTGDALIQTSTETHHVQPEDPEDDLTNLQTSRLRRSSPNDQHSARINDVTDHTQLEFHLGFVLDGVTSYLDLSEHFALSQFGSIDVFWPPSVVLPDDTRPLMYEPGMILNIKGSNFLRGVGADDYIVDVGGGRCETVFVNYSLISCILPQEAPPGDRTTRGGSMIVVRVGTNLEVEYGEIIYASGVNVRLIVGVVAGVVAAVTSLAVGISLIWLIRKRARNPRRKYHYGPVSRTLPPPILMEGSSRSKLTRQTSDHSSYISLKPDIIMDADDRRNQSPRSTLSRAEYSDHGVPDAVYRKVSPRARRAQNPSATNTESQKRAKSVPVGEPLLTSPEYNRSNDRSSLSNLYRVSGNKQQPRLEDVYVNHQPGNKGKNSPRPQITDNYANLPEKAGTVSKPEAPRLPEKTKKREPTKAKISEKSLPSKHQDVPKRKTKTLPSSHKNVPLPRIPTRQSSKDRADSRPGKAALKDQIPMYRRQSSSHSEDEDDIYMNSPIKSKGFNRTRSGGMGSKFTGPTRSSSTLNQKGATLWR